MAVKFLDAGVNPRNIDILEDGKRYDYGLFQVEPVSLYHDVPNFGLKIFIGGEKAIYIVDTGYIDHIEAKNYNLYMIESNHGEEEIATRISEKHSRGEFAYESRAARNHLSREQAMNWLVKNAGPESRYVLLHQHKDARKNE